MLSLPTLERFAKKLPLETGAPKPPPTRAEIIAARLAKWNLTHNDGSVRATYHFILFVTLNDDGEVEFGMKGNPFHIHMDTPATRGADWTQYQRVTNLLHYDGFKPEKIKYYASFSETEAVSYTHLRAHET